ncbi:TPA: hypothetical protein DCX16_02725, partial [bacterium]|nr:hypothetical protein [bacterium]
TIINQAELIGSTTCPQETISAYASATTHIIVPTNLPDLIVSKIKVYPSYIVEEGTRVRIIAWIKNIGNRPANNIKVIFLDGDNQIDGTKTIWGLAPGQTRHSSVVWRARPVGTHTINVIVDPANTIQELREDNNIGTTIVIVKKTKGAIAGTITEKNTGNPNKRSLCFCNR